LQIFRVHLAFEDYYVEATLLLHFSLL